LTAATAIYGHGTTGHAALDYTTANTAVTDAHQVLHGLGTSYPFRFHNDNAPLACAHISTTNFFGSKGINFKASTTGTRPGIGITDVTTDTRSLERFLNLQKDKNARWFDYIKGQMKIFAKHWDSQMNLSDVPTVGGLESSVILHMRTEDEVDTTNHRHMYANTHLGTTHTTDIKWNQNKFSNMSAHAQTTRAGVLRKEELQAITFASSSILPIHGLAATVTHHGPFFEAYGQHTITQQIGDSSSSGPGPIELFSGWRTDVMKEIYREEPVGRK